MDTIKNKVSAAVEEYKKIHKDEYELVIKQIADFRDNLKDDFATTSERKGVIMQGHAIERALYRIPVILDDMILRKLDRDEFNHLSKKEYAKWFTTEFPEFRLTKKF